MRVLIALIVVLSSLIIKTTFALNLGDQAKKGELTSSLAFDQQGYLWRVEVVDGLVTVDKSIDKGLTFTSPAKVNAASEETPITRAIRPEIALDAKEHIHLAWVQQTTKHAPRSVWYAMSRDNGLSFSTPKRISAKHQDGNYVRLAVSDEGGITIIWSVLLGDDLVTSSLYYASSSDEGFSFTPPKQITAGNSPCVGAAVINKNRVPVALWRQQFDDSKQDYMIAEMPLSGQAVAPKRVSFKKWQTDTCHIDAHALALGGEGEQWWGYHIAYFIKGKKPGLYYSRVDGEAWVAFPAKQFGDNVKQQARHPVLLSSAQRVWLAWIETTTDSTQQVMTMHSVDDGKTWSEPSIVLTVKGKIDYPQLLKDKDSVYFAVNTTDGLKVILIN